MSEQGLRQAQQKMREAGVDPVAITVFSHYYRELEAGATGLIRESSISPLLDPPLLAEVAVDDATAREALSKTALIKLNGGLGTSMGVDGVKSLLPVRDGKTFLDLIVDQVQHARGAYGVRLPLILMNSFRTQADSLAALASHPGIKVPGLPLDFLQNQEPKLLIADLTPVSWPADRSLEWCPPGHGDLYTSMLATGVLEALLEAGFRYANTSNADNLGAAPSPALAGWFAASGSPYAAELCRRTAADRKGGHLAIRRSDGRLILRDTAQTAPEEMHLFTDEHQHPYFHTNNLWFDLEALHRALVQRGAVMGLPLIRNIKTVDPTDPSSPQVVQIETAMGTAIEAFEGAQAIVVERARFLPVKTTNDLLLLRSDAYALGADGILRLAVDAAPLIDLDPKYYKTMVDFEARFPDGPPSLRQARSFTVRGDWTFGANVVVAGAGELAETVMPGHVAAGSRIGDPATPGGTMNEPLVAWDDSEGLSRARALFDTTFDGQPDGVWAAPGRVNLIGEHVDYNGGLCMPMALPHRTFAALRRRDDDVVRIVSGLSPDDVWVGRLSGIAPGQVSSWVAYAGGPAWSLGQAGYTLGGFGAAIDSCVPLGAGLSSSAAIECAVAIGLDELFGLGLAGAGDAGRAELAAACVRAENDVAGAPTGGMDQAAALRATAGHALLLDTLDSSVTQVPFDLAAVGLELLVIDTRAEHALVDGQYAARRDACHAAAVVLGVQTLREVTDLDGALGALDDPVQRERVRHVVTEIARVEQFADLVRTGRISEVGPLMDASHESLRTDYEVSCEELDVAVAAARAAGALGARMTGGGFGGSAIALIHTADAAKVTHAVEDAFAAHNWAAPGILYAVPAPGASRVS